MPGIAGGSSGRADVPLQKDAVFVVQKTQLRVILTLQSVQIFRVNFEALQIGEEVPRDDVFQVLESEATTLR